MNIDASLSTAMSNTDLSSKVSTRVARMALDQAKTQGEQMVQLIRSASPSSNNAGGDSTTGTQIDVTA